jgi:hypothetical protein
MIVTGLLCGAPASAQQGVTLQLPTFSFFSVATTVVVPDRGGAYLGGVGRASSGRSRFGVGQSAFGFERHAAGLHATAHLHDLQGMDEALLRGGARPATISPLAQRLAQSQSDKNDALASLQEIERRRLAAAQAEQAEAADFFARGRDAQAAGKTSLAKTYYGIALRRASGELRQQIAAQIQQFAAGAPRVAAQR